MPSMDASCSRNTTLLWAAERLAPLRLQIERRPAQHRLSKTSTFVVCHNNPKKGLPASTTSWTPFRWELKPKYDSKFVTVGKYRAHYLAAGTTGNKDILILASQVVVARSYRSTLNALSRKHRVICVELPGCGRSDSVQSPFTHQQSAEWLTQFMKQLDIQSAVVIGHSCSGPPAIALAASHSDRVSHLVLMSSIGGHAPRALAKVVVGRVHDALLELQYSIPGVFHGLYNVPFQPGNFWYWVRMSSTLDITSEAAAVRVPTLLCWGKHDHTCRLPAGRRFAEVMPTSQLYISEQGSHNWLIQRPEEFAEVVSTFIDGTEASGRTENVREQALQGTMLPPELG